MATETDPSVEIESVWCAFAPGKEAWKRDGNYFSATEIAEIDRAEDLAVYQPTAPILCAD